MALATLPASPAQANAGLPPGVHIDPGSPAAKEYAIPLSAARQTGAGSGGGSSSSLFGAGIAPRGPGSPPNAHSGTAGRGGATKISAGGSAAGLRAEHVVARESLPSSVLASSSRVSGDGDSLLALLAGGAGILVLGGLGGTFLRRARRRSTDPA